MSEWENIAIVPLFADALPSGVYSYGDISVRVHTRRKKVQDGLFCDDIWPGAILMSDYLVMNKYLVEDKYVLELGAGAALPSLVGLHLHSRFSTITDYPGDDVISNIYSLLIENELYNPTTENNNVAVLPYIWGEDVTPLLKLIPNMSPTEMIIKNNHTSKTIIPNDEIKKYDVILLAELLWKDTYTLHRSLLSSILLSLSLSGIALLSYASRTTPDHTIEREREFFTLAKEQGLNCRLVERREMDEVCGERGDRENDFERVEVMLYSLSWKREEDIENKTEERERKQE
mmetsp:Transcript_663/g.677  ORF Transcript_663/g.677 Transcript_663/m.677 type:complete len:289 (+) Transcript_663:116-982(+)